MPCSDLRHGVDGFVVMIRGLNYRSTLLFVVHALVLLGCTRDPDRPEIPLRLPDGSAPNVLLITIDTLRADHLGCYGYRLDTSASIDGLSASGTRFADAITPVPTTAPAIASLLSGSLADVHRVTENGGTLAASVDTLGEAFASAGYQTAAFIGNGALAHGFDQGFADFEPFWDAGPDADAAGSAAAAAWVRTAAEPWFLWVHFMNPHGPYDSSPAALSADLTYPDDPALSRELEVGAGNLLFGVIPRYQALPGLRRIVDYVRRYDGEIIGTAAHVATVYQGLIDAGLDERTLTVLTADHGENLVEWGYYFQHGQLLTEGSIRVPLILHFPGMLPQMVSDTPASLLDIFPTVARLLGLPLPRGVEGADLTPALFGRASPERTLFAHTVTPSRLAAVRRGRWKLVRVPARYGVAGGKPQLALYEPAADPAEQENAADGHPEVVDLLLPTLEREVERVASGFGPSPALSLKERERLRALGYLD
jgi:arylsulfatase